jgi:hypothetical protein
MVNVEPLLTSGILLPEKYLLLVASYFNYKVIVYVFLLANGSYKNRISCYTLPFLSELKQQQIVKCIAGIWMIMDK